MSGAKAADHFNSDPSEFNNKSKNELILLETLKHYPQWNKLIHKLEKNFSSDTEQFLDYLFYKTHQLVLKKYSRHSDFSEMISSGNYDCVSASMVYSLLLNHFEIDHSIIETDYHVFLVARVNSRDYVLESTDPLNGFIKDENAVITHIAQFRPAPLASAIQNTTEIGAEDYSPKEVNTIYKEITIQQLTGLQYYNHGIYAINNSDLATARVQILKALSLYPSERIRSVLALVSDLEKKQ